MRRRFKRRGAQRGMALVMTMALITAMAILGVTYMSLSANTSRITRRAYQKAQATAMAEAGVHAMFSQATRTLRSTFTLPGSIATTAVASSFSGSSSSDGSYAASIISAPYVRTAVVDGAGVTTGYIDTYTVTTEGVGTSPDGLTQSKVRATFSVAQREQDVAGSGSPYTFPENALVSNGNILLQGSSQTISSGAAHIAGAGANGVISNNGSAYRVDGAISVAPASYAASVAALGGSPNCYGGAVTQLPSPINFPDSATISSWKQTWLADAQQATLSYPGGHTLTGAAASSSSIITGPAYINGDLNISNGSPLTIQPDPAAPSPYVVYVHGNITFSNGNCSLLNKGVVLVCDGTFSAGNNATYSTTSLTAGGLISLSTSSNAISIGGGANAQIGLCYAVNGGISLSGNGTLTGSVISGAQGASGGVSLTGTPDVIYPQGLNSNFTGLLPADNLTVVQQYTPTSPMNWSQTL